MRDDKDRIRSLEVRVRELEYALARCVAVFATLHHMGTDEKFLAEILGPVAEQLNPDVLKGWEPSE